MSSPGAFDPLGADDWDGCRVRGFALLTRGYREVRPLRGRRLCCWLVGPWVAGVSGEAAVGETAGVSGEAVGVSVEVAGPAGVALLCSRG